MSKSAAEKRAYDRAYYAKNRERIRAMRNTEDNLTRCKEREKKWRNKNKERLRALAHARYLRNKAKDPDGYRERARLAMQRHRAADPEGYRKKAREVTARWRAKNPDYKRPRPEYYREYGKRKRERIRATVLEHYGNKCACCGESHNEFLCVDHVNGDGAEHRRRMGVKKGSGPIYAWLIKNNFPPGFRLLCHNCNLAYGFYGHCPHQAER